MIMNSQWPGWWSLGLFGFPIANICYKQTMAYHRRAVEATFWALDLKARMVIVYGCAAVSAFAVACYSLWRIVGHL